MLSKKVSGPNTTFVTTVVVLIECRSWKILKNQPSFQDYYQNTIAFKHIIFNFWYFYSYTQFKSRFKDIQLEFKLFIYYCYFLCFILGMLCSLLCLPVFHDCPLFLYCILWISALPRKNGKLHLYVYRICTDDLQAN